MKIVIVNCFETFEQRVDALKTVFEQKNHQVTVLQSNFRHIEKAKRTDSKSGFIFFDAAPYQKNLSAARMKSHARLSQDIFRYVRQHEKETDLLWVIVPPNSFVKDAAQIKKDFPRIRLVYDLNDLWPESLPIPFVKKFWPLTVWRDLRNKYLSCADYVVTECRLYQKVLKNHLKEGRYSALYMTHPDREVTPSLHTDDNVISLCYLGSINNIIDISAAGRLIQTLSKKKPVRLHVVGDGEKRAEFLETCKNAGAEVFYHGKVYDNNEKQAIFDQCNYGLNIMKPTVCVGLTLKSMDYFEAGLPIINNIVGDTWNFVEENGIGVNFTAGKEIDLLKTSDEENRQTVLSFYKNNLSWKTFCHTAEKIIDLI